MARIVLDTDVVSRYRAGRLPAGSDSQVVANDLCIAFATAGLGYLALRGHVWWLPG